jgi:hypothetical protein
VHEVGHVHGAQARVREQQLRVAAGDDGGRGPAARAQRVGDEPFDETRVAAQHARIDACLRRTAGHRGRRRVERSGRQRGCHHLHARDERAQSRRDRTAAERAVGLDEVDGRRRAAVDDDRAAVQAVRRERTHPSVGTERVHRLVVERQRTGQLGARDAQRDAARTQQWVQRRERAVDDAHRDAARERSRAEERLQRGDVGGLRGDPRAGTVVVAAEVDRAVATVGGQQAGRRTHAESGLRARRRVDSGLGVTCSAAPGRCDRRSGRSTSTWSATCVRRGCSRPRPASAPAPSTRPCGR